MKRKGSAIKLKVDGIRESRRAVALLASAAERRVARSALGKGATVVLKAARRAVPKGDAPSERDRMRALKRSMGRRNVTYPRVTRLAADAQRPEFSEEVAGSFQQANRNLRRATQVHVVTIIGPRYNYRDAKTGLKPSTYAWRVHRGDMDRPARPFLTTALISSQGAASAAIRQGMRDGIEREARKAAKRAGVKGVGR